MTPLFSATFPIDPVPWQRATPMPCRMITAAETRAYERTLGELARFKMGPRAPLDEPLSVNLTFLLSRPPRFHRRFYPDVWCDIDNLTKSTLDGLNKILWKDDRRIVELYARKAWAKERGSLLIAVYSTKELRG